jgi:ribonuclease R
MEVSVLKVLGAPDDPRTEIEKILACADISDEFPEKVARIAEHVPREVGLADHIDRTDLRHVPFTTIDPETARDFDDAVALEELPGGIQRLWVAVADVSHYVREGSPIDDEARRRGVSVYLPNRAIPMLPEALSGHMCSLVPEQDRLALVARIDVDRHLEIVGTDFCAAIIHSRARLDYPGVAAALGGDTRGKRKKYEAHLPALRAMDSLARRLRKRRQERGALDLDLPEPVIVLDDDNPQLVRDIRASRRDPGERQAYSMIEEFMLAANEAVGESFAHRKEDTLWRVHDVPDEGKVEMFANLAESYGITVDIDEARTPKGLARVLERLSQHAASKSLSFQLLRSLKQATYDLVNVGHFGLASEAYLHFTSPIRRYPDLIVHRLLKRRLAEQGKTAGGFPRLSAAPPPPDAERKAMEVEREVVDLYRAFFLRDRIGDEFKGTISGAASFGIFVTVEEPFVEGLVRMEDLGNDYFVFDEASCRIVGKRSGRMFSLGDEVTVEVQSVSVARRKIDFKLKQHHGAHAVDGVGAREGRAHGKGRHKDEARGRRRKGADGLDRGRGRQPAEKRGRDSNDRRPASGDHARPGPRPDSGGHGQRKPRGNSGGHPRGRGGHKGKRSR